MFFRRQKTTTLKWIPPLGCQLNFLRQKISDFNGQPTYSFDDNGSRGRAFEYRFKGCGFKSDWKLGFLLFGSSGLPLART